MVPGLNTDENFMFQMLRLSITIIFSHPHLRYTLSGAASDDATATPTREATWATAQLASTCIRQLTSAPDVPDSVAGSLRSQIQELIDVTLSVGELDLGAGLLYVLQQLQHC